MSRATSGDVPKAGQTIGRFAIVAELGRRAPPSFAALASTIGAAPELVVVETIATASAPLEEVEAFVRNGKRLAQTRHPNVARVRDVVVSRDRVVLVSDFVEGQTLAALLAADAAADTRRLGLPEQLRILVDVLSGMSAIHLAPPAPSSTAEQDAPLFHGAIHPRNIVVGIDGSSRLIRTIRAPIPHSSDRASAVEEAGYAAPELLLGDATSGAGVDIYAMGVLLWEVLSGSPLFTEPGEKEVLARQLAGTLPRAEPPGASEWASALVDVAARALEVDPDKRFSSTAELAGALRLAVQARLAPASRVASCVTALASQELADRRERLRAAPKMVTQTLATSPTKVQQSELAAKIAIANPPKISAQKTTELGLPRIGSDPDASDPAPETKRLRVESIDDDDLRATEDEGLDSKWSSVPPPKKPSIAPPLPTRALHAVTPPVPVVVPVAAPPVAIKPVPTKVIAKLAPEKQPEKQPEKPLVGKLTMKGVPKVTPQLPAKAPSVPTPAPTPVVVVAPIDVAPPAPPAAPPPAPLVAAAISEQIIQALPEPEPAFVQHVARPASPPAWPAAPIAPASPPSTDNVETMTPAIATTHATPAISAPFVHREESSGPVAGVPDEAEKRRRRLIVVFASIGFAALLLLVAGIKHFTSGPPEPLTTTTTSTTTTASTSTSAAAAATTPDPQAATIPPAIATPPIPTPTAVATVDSPAPVENPVAVATSQTPVTSTTPATPHDAATHPATVKPAHKKPPHSNYEPEGI